MNNITYLYINGKYRPYIGRDKDDDGEGAEPCISNSEEHIFGHIRSREIFQCENHHANSHWQ
jgi:hypothetical protein